jgi:hypothetical protein
MVEQGGPPAVARLARDGCVRRGALLPTPQAETPPRARESAPGGLRRFPLVALRWGIAPRPARMPDGCGGPLDERLSEALRPRAAPGHPRFLATGFGDWRAPRIFLPCSGGSRAFPLFAAGDEPPGGADGACPGERREPGESGLVLRARCAGVLNGLDGLSGAPELVAQGLAESGMGGENPLIGGPGGGGLDGVEARGNNLRRAPVVVAHAAGAHGPPGELRRFAGRPAAQTVTEHAGGFVLEPLPHLWDRVLQGAREAGGEPHCLPDHTTAVFNALGERPHRGALRLERLQRVARGEEPCAREGGVGGVVFGAAWGAGFAIACQRQRIDERTEAQQVGRAPGRDQRPCVACEADGHGGAVDPSAQRAAPHRAGCGGVRERETLACCGVRRLETPLMVGLRPVDSDKGRQFFGRYLRPASPPGVCESGEKGPAR